MRSLFEQIFGARADLTPPPQFVYHMVKQASPTPCPKSGATGGVVPAAVQEDPAMKRRITIGCGVVVVQRGGTGRFLTLVRLGGPWDGRRMLVGGHPEEGECVHDAAVRETFEETGLVVVPKTVNGSYIFYTNEWICTDPFKHHFSVYVAADEVGGTLRNREPKKHRDLRWMTIDEVEGETGGDQSCMPSSAIRRWDVQIGLRRP
jgi:ADP-ribose pyrophosphatase YjhB (NUDIX family)